MSAIYTRPTAEELRSVFNYNPETGIFTRRFVSSGVKTVGTIGGRGYVQINYKAKVYYAHILAWVIVTGEWPTDQIDHRDRCRTNNSFLNLRAASVHQQLGNQGLYSNNTSGVRGVHKRKNRFEAILSSKHGHIRIGVFGNIEDAAAAYANAARTYFGEFANPARAAAQQPKPALAVFETQEAK